MDAVDEDVARADSPRPGCGSTLASWAEFRLEHVTSASGCTTEAASTAAGAGMAGLKPSFAPWTSSGKPVGASTRLVANAGHAARRSHPGEGHEVPVLCEGI
ncbi:hypothetical protein LZ32DRAFT_659218 [Colletotrichum eremochloae]|nr:hypothetical protein LZ32DRAFT_659218 [Colletotrichum eremochloae]